MLCAIDYTNAVRGDLAWLLHNMNKQTQLMLILSFLKLSRTSSKSESQFPT